MSDYAYLTPFFSHSHLIHLRLQNGWIGPDDQSTLSPSPNQSDEWKSLNIPKEHIIGTTPLKILELKDCRILPQILEYYVKAPKALVNFSFQEFITESDEEIFELPCSEYLVPLLPHKDYLELIHLHLFKIPEHRRWSQSSSCLASFANLKALSVDLITVFGYQFGVDLPWHGLGHYLPTSLEVLELRIVVDTTRNEDWNQYTTQILSRISTESPLALPRLRIMKFLEMRLVTHSADIIKLIEPDYTQIEEAFEFSGIHFSVELYGYYHTGFNPVWDSRKAEQNYIDKLNLLMEQKKLDAGPKDQM
jgi:hypothetical protein